MKILLAVDGSKSSLGVVDQAAKLPWPEQSEIKILSVAEIPSPAMAGPLPMPGAYYVEWEKALEDQAAANVEQALARFQGVADPATKVHAEWVKGNTKEALLNVAKEWGADLIMIGTHGYNPFERMWLGSVSRAVSSHAPCSVEIVRASDSQQRSGGMRLLIGVDGSPFSVAAVREVAQRPWPVGTEVRLVTAIHLPTTPTMDTWVLPDDYYQQAEEAGKEQAERVLREAEEVLTASNAGRSTPLALSREAIVGHPEEILLTVAKEWGADLILLGSHGYRAWERFLLGSVSQAIAWHAQTSVQIVRIHGGESELQG
jgi:nucleotide-binding universal stress UspA family protein